MRSKVDAIFKEAMQVAGVPKLTYLVMYMGLRFFSKIHFWESDNSKRALKVQLQESWDLSLAPELLGKVI